MIFLFVTFSTCSVKPSSPTMSKFVLLLSILPAAVLCECQLKDNAQDLLFVGYFSDGRTFTYVDIIEVKMKDASFRQFGRLLFQGECKSMNARLNVALYKREEDKIKLVAKATRRYKGKVRFETLDPCASYEVNVTIGNLDVGLYKLGPYYSQEGVTYPLLATEDNPFYENNTQEIKSVITQREKAVLELGAVCAKMATLHLREKMTDLNETSVRHWEKTTMANVTKRITPGTEGEEKLTVNDLKPCTLYTVDIELWLDDNRDPVVDGDFRKDNIFQFYTGNSSVPGNRQIVKTGSDKELPNDCSCGKINCLLKANKWENQVLQITIAVSVLVVLVATIVACALTLYQRQRGHLEMEKLGTLPDSSSFIQSPVYTHTVPVENEPEAEEETVVLLKYSHLSKL